MSFQKSTRELKQEVLKIAGELTDGTSSFDADAVSYLNTVYNYLITGNSFFNVSCSEPWIWAQAKYPILTTLKPDVSTAAILTNNSTICNFSAAPTISLEGRHIRFDGYSDIYKITRHSANATYFNIDQAFIGSSGTYNCTASKYDYEAYSTSIIIDNRNNRLDFSEGGSEINSVLTNGTYTSTTLCTEIALQMTTDGAGTYTCSFNSITRKFTINGSGTFSLLFGSGTYAKLSASAPLGFDVEDQTGDDSYTGQYSVSGIARISKPISIYKGGVSYSAPQAVNKIFMIDDNTFLREFPINRLEVAIPDKFCPIEQNQDGLWSLRFNASVLEETRIEINYIPVARALVDNVNSIPLVPGAFSDFLVYGAAHFIQVDKSDSKAQDSLNKAISQLNALIAFNRQGSQIAGNNFGKMTPRMSHKRQTRDSGSAY